MNNIFTNPPTLSDYRIALVPMELVHAEGLFQVQSPGIWDFMTSRNETIEAMESLVHAAVQTKNEGSALPFVVTLKNSGKVIGTTRLYDFNFNNKSCEIGFTWYGADYQRTFVNTTCKLLLLEYCFETLGFNRVQFQTDERNIRSQTAIERLGASKEGILRKHKVISSGYVRNSVLYSIINDEWPKIKENLKQKLAN
ncbi:GNAT family N-acetyltransferase [Fictibacillus barbaricus]|uniref:RimJ/RimL family protein N-acetyltransferase n=1 Tax=Fictibacillus barbaricus TaxID=182136 RepID=A0ABU1TW74_9BACL|nr:GNAT family protein [Fictibacillus barbaricus]MDR7071456.1 RimJ/RimL family protein N-acetyltransferase [Fictibacillus barbaricus]